MQNCRNEEVTFTQKIYKLPKNEQKEIAKRFAEGSHSLEELLLEIWQNNMQTFACCAGHNQKFCEPYILFEIGNFNYSQTNDFFNKLILDIIDKNTPCKFLQFAVRFYKEEEFPTVTIYFKERDEENFKFISDLINSVLDNENMLDYINRHNIKAKLNKEQREFLDICVNLKFFKLKNILLEKPFNQNISIAIREDEKMFQNIELEYEKIGESGKFNYNNIFEIIKS